MTSDNITGSLLLTVILSALFPYPLVSSLIVDVLHCIKAKPSVVKLKQIDLLLRAGPYKGASIFMLLLM
jgi:hypothetical protein